MRSRSSLALFLLSLPFSGAALALETDLLERQAGFTEKRMGARVESVEDVAGTDQQKILVSVPAKEGKEPPEIEEVVVTAPEMKPEVLEKPRYEFVRDYTNDRYGFVIYLGRQKNLPFRIYFKDDHALNPTTQELQ